MRPERQRRHHTSTLALAFHSPESAATRRSRRCATATPTPAWRTPIRQSDADGRAATVAGPTAAARWRTATATATGGTLHTGAECTYVREPWNSLHAYCSVVLDLFGDYRAYVHDFLLSLSEYLFRLAMVAYEPLFALGGRPSGSSRMNTFWWLP